MRILSFALANGRGAYILIYSKPSRLPTVDVIYTHFPHYRESVFRSLLRSTRLTYRFYFDHHGIDCTIRSGTRNFPATHLRSYKIGKLVFQIGALLHTIRTDADILVLQGNPYILTNWIVPLIAFARRRKVYFWTHGWISKDSGVKSMFRLAFYRLADGLLVYGKRAQRLGIEAGYPARRIHVIYNSLNYNEQRSLRRRIEAIDSFRHLQPKSEPYFLVVGRLLKRLELDILLHAMIPLRQHSRLVVVGDGPELGRLMEMSKRLELKVSFLGEIYDEKFLATLFISACAVVSPGKIGILALHALAYGTPVVTHDNFDFQMPEAEAIDEGLTGFFFKRRDVVDLSSTLSLLLSESKSLLVTRAKRLQAIRKIEQFYTPDVQVRLIEKALLADQD